MPIRIPQNQLTIKYTAGKEYTLKGTNTDYVGYYYELNGKTFAGERFNTKSPMIIKKINISNIPPIENTLPVTVPKINDIPSIPMNLFVSGIKYFAKKINVFPANIISISEEDYDLNKDKNPFYAFTDIEYHSEWGFKTTDQNIKDIPEIEIYLRQYSNLDFESL